MKIHKHCLKDIMCLINYLDKTQTITSIITVPVACTGPAPHQLLVQCPRDVNVHEGNELIQIPPHENLGPERKD